MLGINFGEKLSKITASCRSYIPKVGKLRTNLPQDTVEITTKYNGPYINSKEFNSFLDTLLKKGGSTTLEDGTQLSVSQKKGKKIFEILGPARTEETKLIAEIKNADPIRVKDTITTNSSKNGEEILEILTDFLNKEGESIYKYDNKREGSFEKNALFNGQAAEFLFKILEKVK